MPNVLVIDNYDSFTWNLVHLIGPLCGTVDVVRNDALTIPDIRAKGAGRDRAVARAMHAHGGGYLPRRGP